MSVGISIFLNKKERPEWEVIMANTKNTKNKSGKTSTSAKGKRKKKNSSDDTIKFLLVLVIAAIAIALIFFSNAAHFIQGKLRKENVFSLTNHEKNGILMATENSKSYAKAKLSQY